MKFMLKKKIRLGACFVVLSILMIASTVCVANASTIMDANKTAMGNINNANLIEESCGQLTTPWAIKADGKTVAYVANAEDGRLAIEGLRVYYYNNVFMQQGAEIEPFITVEKVNEGLPEGQRVMSVKDAVNFIAKQNEAKEPVVAVAYSKTLKEKKEIKPKKKVIKTAELEKGEKKVKSEGKTGSKYVESEIKQVNSEVVNKDVMNSKVVEKPKTEVVYEGTALSSENKGKAVVAFAKKYLGNKYVWGGESLENGVDCSGYMMKCYEHYGISLPHSSEAQGSCGEEVSQSEMQAGDLIVYKGHVAMYMGDGRIIHAAGESVGIIISGDPNYSNILHVRRIFGTGADTSTDNMFPDVSEIEKAYNSERGFGDDSGLSKN